MKAVLYDRYGSPEVLYIGERPVPVPGPNEVLVRVLAAGLNPKDVLMRKGRFRAWSWGSFPRSCGYDFAGVVEKVGPEVTHLQPPDLVFGMINGLFGRTAAEWVVADVDELVAKPPGLSFEAAAGLPLVACTALQALRDCGQLAAGQTAVINGASGGVGTMAVQIAKRLGARVIAICSSRNVDLVRELGADEVRAYDVVHPLQGLSEIDVFFDVFGNQSIHQVFGLLAPRGQYVTTVPKLRNLLDVVGTRFARRRAHLVVVHSNRRDLEIIRRWLEETGLHPVIDRVYELSEVAEAHRYIETRRARGKVVLRVSPAEV